MTREIGKEVCLACKEQAEADHADLIPTLELVSKQQGWGQNSLLHRGIHTFLTGEIITAVTLHTSDMHTSIRVPQELLSDPLWNLHMNSYSCIRVLFKAVPEYLAKHLRKAYGAPW